MMQMCIRDRHGGIGLGTTPELAAKVTKMAKAAANKPVYVKSVSYTHLRLPLTIYEICERRKTLYLRTARVLDE